MTYRYVHTTITLAGAVEQLEEARLVLEQRIRNARELEGLSIAEIAAEGASPLAIAGSLGMTISEVREQM